MEDHGEWFHFGGLASDDPEEGKRIAVALGDYKAAILANHGLITVGQSVDEAVFWFTTMERTCQAELLAMAAGDPVRSSSRSPRVFMSKLVHPWPVGTAPNRYSIGSWPSSPIASRNVKR